MTTIILEGCDCSGKSRLAKKLQQITGYEIVQGSSFEIAKLGTDAMYEHMVELLDRKDIIIDRFYLSNYVYGNLFNYPTMNDEQFEHLAVLTEKQKALTVYVTANVQTLKGRMAHRGDDMIKAESIEAILQKYDEALRGDYTLQQMMLHVNTSFHNGKRAAETIVDLAQSLSFLTRFDL